MLQLKVACDFISDFIGFYIYIRLKQRELEMQRMKEGENETEMERDERPLPSMQSCGTQTEQVV